MDKSLKSVSGYRQDDFYGEQLIDKGSETGDFSLTDAEQKTSEVLERLNALGFTASIPDHRVKPQDE